MKIECEEDRINLIPENDEDRECLRKAVPDASESFCWYTLSAGKEGNPALVISHR